MKHFKNNKTFKFVSAFIIIMIAALLTQSFSVMSLSKYGSSGSEVRSIQTRLTELGYFSGKVDGIFGSQTKNAVIKFQKDYGLTADGIVGSNTLKALKLKFQSSPNKFTQSEISLLARIISAESRGLRLQEDFEVVIHNHHS